MDATITSRSSAAALYGLIAAAACWLLVWAVGQRMWHLVRQWRMLRHLPGPPPTHAILGHVPDFVSTEAPMRLAAWAAQYGGVFRIRFFYAFGLVVTDPVLVRAILQSSKTYVPKDRALLTSLEIASGVPMPNILTSSDGDYWRLVRGAWMKCFTSTNLKRVLPILQDICERVTLQIQQQAAAAGVGAVGAAAADGNSRTEAAAVATAPVAAPPAAAGAGAAAGAHSTAPSSSSQKSEGGHSSQKSEGAVLVNICHVMDRITLDVIGQLSYGRDFGAVDHKRSRYLELVSSMLALMHEEMDHPLRRLLRKLSRSDTRAKALLRAEWDATNTAEVVRTLAEQPGEHTIAGQLLALRDPATQQPLSLQQLKSELVIATLAGFETTSNALSWTLGSLAAHPQALAALEQELDAAGLLASPDNPHPQRFEWQTLGKLQWLQACIREGLRLFSPAANGSWRLCTTSDITINKGLTIPKGTPVGIPFYAFGRNPATYGPDADEFKPERWLAGRSSSSTSSSMMTASGASMSSTDDGSGGGAGAGAGSQQQQQQPRVQDPWTFSIGSRDCAGQALARLELQVVIAAVVGNFRVALAPEVGGWEGLLGRRMFHTTLQVRGGLPLLLTPRVPLAA